MFLISTIEISSILLSITQDFSFNIATRSTEYRSHLQYIIKTKGYYGVNIVFNYLNISNQIYYYNYITKVSNRLKSEGYFVFVTINPIINYVNNEIVFEKVDYGIYRQVVDSILFLQFVWGTNYDPPAPVSSIDKLSAFMNYVITSVPPNKVTVGKPVIGYDWALPYTPGKSYANSLSLNSAINLARDVGATIQFDETSQTPFFTYTRTNFGMLEEHIVWFIDARSISALVQLNYELGLSGAGLWNVMIFSPQLWLVFNTQFEIEKLLF
jgi:spore germination protein